MSDRRIGATPPSGAGPLAEAVTGDEAPVIVSLFEAAMQMFTAAIQELPDADDPAFPHRCAVILAGLRKLQTTLTHAAGRQRATPSVVVALSTVRTRYDDLMAAAAEGPGATVGQRLYVARRRARLSARETAYGAALRADLLDDIEGADIPPEADAVKIKELIAALGG